MKILKKILFLSLLFALLSTCKKSDFDLECTDANTIKPAKDAIDYFYFKRGTWWLYQEDSTGLIDSVWISRDTLIRNNSSAYKRECKCGFGKCSQHLYIDFANKAYNPDNGKRFNGISIGSSLTYGDCAVYDGSDYCFVGSGVRMSYEGGKFKSPTDQGAILENLDSLVVKGKTFKDIIHHYYTFQTNIPDWLHEAWYARNMYLVKYRKYDGTNWSLIDYHIVK